MRQPLLVLVAAAAPFGCGAEKAATPSTILPADAPLSEASYKREGMTVSLPRAMRVLDRKPPGVFRATLEEWYVAGLVYKRTEQLPGNDRELRAARRRLVREVRRRDRGFRLVSAATTRVNGARAVQLVGDQELSNRRLRTRSLHVYRGRAEYVLEMAAPADDFRTLDANVFDRVADSLAVTGKPR